MARKKPEAVQALEAMRPPCACGAPAIMWRDGRDWCSDCRDRFTLEQASANLKGTDLARLPGESIEAWRRRMLNWLKANVAIKKFGRAA